MADSVDPSKESQENKDDEGLGGLDEPDDGKLKLCSKPGEHQEEIDIERKHAFVSVLVKTSIENGL